MKVWGNLTNESCEGKGKEIKLTPHISPIKGNKGTKIILADGALPVPCISKMSDTKILRGLREKCLNFPIFSVVKCAIDQISETVGDINPLFAPDC